MRSHMLAIGSLVAVGGTALLGRSIDPAEAQSACVSQCLANGWARVECRKYCETRPGELRGPRVYGYSYRSGAATAGFCGAYFYWNGERCVDARNVPPPLTGY